MEHILSVTDHDNGLGIALRPFHTLRLEPSLRHMATRPSDMAVCVPSSMDVSFQQDSEAVGPFLPLPCRCRLHSCLHRLRLPSRSDQVVGLVHFERGKLTVSHANEWSTC